ncbi:hypothetical protein LWI28_013960 [Acer negundo]|uniref:Uncharacterized protein n=1 Tax=Acer negundo TaxID=4023 RepID=A0AAD5JAH3_ACENE|nr:hypothetical protein LWI28_013960 [Acer negundo]
MVRRNWVLSSGPSAISKCTSHLSRWNVASHRQLRAEIDRLYKEISAVSLDIHASSWGVIKGIESYNVNEDNVLGCLQPWLFSCSCTFLDSPFSAEDVQVAVFDMGLSKVLGPDGLPACLRGSVVLVSAGSVFRGYRCLQRLEFSYGRLVMSGCPLSSTLLREGS